MVFLSFFGFCRSLKWLSRPVYISCPWEWIKLNFKTSNVVKEAILKLIELHTENEKLFVKPGIKKKSIWEYIAEKISNIDASFSVSGASVSRNGRTSLNNIEILLITTINQEMIIRNVYFTMNWTRHMGIVPMLNPYVSKDRW